MPFEPPFAYAARGVAAAAAPPPRTPRATPRPPRPAARNMHDGISEIGPRARSGTRECVRDVPRAPRPRPPRSPKPPRPGPLNGVGAAEATGVSFFGFFALTTNCSAWPARRGGESGVSCPGPRRSQKRRGGDVPSAIREMARSKSPWASPMAKRRSSSVQSAKSSFAVLSLLPYFSRSSLISSASSSAARKPPGVRGPLAQQTPGVQVAQNHALSSSRSREVAAAPVGATGRGLVTMPPRPRPRRSSDILGKVGKAGRDGTQAS